MVAREELGLNPADLGSPWSAAISSFCAFSVGAVLPVLPFLSGTELPVALAQSVIHLVIGLAIGSLVTGAAASASRPQPRGPYDV